MAIEIASSLNEKYLAVNKGFSKQSEKYDEDDASNPILQNWRIQVYDHVDSFIKPSSSILELNSGTGIDAVRFAKQGHKVHCVELSDGMVHEIKKKIELNNLASSLTVQQLSYECLEEVTGKYDYVFSNFGGLNCSSELTKITQHFHRLLKPGGIVTWVIMPPICLWEITWIFKGYFKNGLRRFHKNGVMAHLEGQYFMTYYYSLSDLKKAFSKSFTLLKCEGLGALSPPPSAPQFITKYPKLYKLLTRLDQKMRMNFPFNRWADHIIVTFQIKN